MELMIIMIIISVLTGLDKGIRRLSEVNFNFSLIVLFFIFFACDTFFIINLFIQGIGYHFQWIFELTFNTQAFEQAGFTDIIHIDDEENDLSNYNQQAWMSWWTVFYWAWWIAWAPFVGIFIAQISRGRTVRTFILGNMMVPTLFTAIWLTVFGGLGLYNELASISNDIDCDINADNLQSIYDGRTVTKLSCYSSQDMLWAAIDTLPLSSLIKVLSIIGIMIYFITSSDSASHVIDILTASGNDEPPKLQRIFWALTEGAVASVLLASGGNDSLTALQTGSLVAALPFCVVLLFETYATIKIFKIHYGEIDMNILNYWRYDLFECSIKFTKYIIFGIICPPYFQTKTRLKLIKHNKLHDEDDINDILYDKNYNDDFFKYFWIICYWFTWLLCIIFLICAIFINGMLELGLTFYLFYIMVCVINRNMIRNFYNINSSNTCYSLMSWVFCFCCAVIQEDLQSNQNTSIELKLKNKNKNKINNKYMQEMTDMDNIKNKTDNGINQNEINYDNDGGNDLLSPKPKSTYTK